MILINKYFQRNKIIFQINYLLSIKKNSLNNRTAEFQIGLGRHNI